MNTIVTAVLLGSDHGRQTFVAGASLVAAMVGTGAATTPPAGDSPSTARAEEATPGEGHARLATVAASLR